MLDQRATLTQRCKIRLDPLPHNRARFWMVSIACVLVSIPGACGGSASPGTHFDERVCPFVVDASQIQGTTMRCGILYTPEVHASPARYIQVPILIFKGSSPTLPPVVNLSGGPGQSWADLGLDTLTASNTQSLPTDFVFIEQRGTGLSRPRLDCPAELKNDTAAGYAARCASDLRAQGTNIAAYNIQEMAEDVASFQSALGYPKIVLDGVSYGTAWGLQILRSHSPIVRSAILDSVVTPTIPVFSESASTTDAAFTAAFTTCASDSSCSGVYGDLRSKMEAALPQLKAAPLKLAGTTTSYDDNALFGDAVSILAFAPDLLPRMIDGVAAALASGSGQLLYDSDLGAIIGLDTTALSGSAQGQYLSVVCADNQFVTQSQVRSDLAKVTPAFAPYLDYSSDLALCQAWSYQQRNPSDYAAVTSAVPTLLTSGSFDPLTSPSWAEQAAGTLASAYWVEFPGLGHDEGASSDPCPAGILTQFLLSAAAPDTSCVQSMKVAFAAPATPITVVMQLQRPAQMAAAQTAPLSFAPHLAVISRIENLIMRRHLRQRLVELTFAAR
jgi:pimeloyl-ACP methyl ester carboxylesterase